MQFLEKVTEKRKNNKMANLFKNHKGLGDTVEAFTTATGIKAIVKAGSKAFNKPCGCDERKKTLNDLFPYGNKK